VAWDRETYIVKWNAREKVGRRSDQAISGRKRIGAKGGSDAWRACKRMDEDGMVK